MFVGLGLSPAPFALAPLIYAFWVDSRFPFFAPQSSLSFCGNIHFLLDLHHYLGNLTFTFRFREIYLLLQVKIHRHRIDGLNFIRNCKWASSRVLGLFGPFFDFRRFYDFLETTLLDTTSS